MHESYPLSSSHLQRLEDKLVACKELLYFIWSFPNRRRRNEPFAILGNGLLLSVKCHLIHKILFLNSHQMHQLLIFRAVKGVFLRLLILIGEIIKSTMVLVSLSPCIVLVTFVLLIYSVEAIRQRCSLPSISCTACHTKTQSGNQ